MDNGGRTSAISAAILATLTRLVSSSDTTYTTLSKSLLQPTSLAIKSFEDQLVAESYESSIDEESASDCWATVVQALSTQSQRNSTAQRVRLK